MTSIIIPTLNAEKLIGKLLQALKSQTDKSEIIIIDSSSTDKTVQIAESFGVRIIIIRKEEFDHGGSRTIAGKTAEGDILLYMTQDALPVDKDAIKKLIKPFADKTIGAAYGRQVPFSDALPFGAHNRLFNYPENSCVKGFEDKEKYKIKTPFLSNSFAAYRKNVLEEIGWFKENLISTEDTFAGAKILLAGYKIAYVNDAIVCHSHNYTALQEFKRYFDIGVFHKQENWISENFGKAEGEGIRYIRSELAFLTNNRKYHLLPVSFIRNGLKYVGYNLGRKYERIPESIIKKISMHKDWWNKIP